MFTAPTYPAPAPVRARRRTGRTWVIVATLTCVLALVLGTLAVLVGRTQPLSLDITEPTYAKAQQLKVGHCLKAVPSDPQVTSVIVVPCTSGHRGQVIAETTFAGAVARKIDRPDPSVLAGATETTCAAVGVHGAPDDATYTAWIPTPDSWRQRDRRGLCILQAATLVGTALP